MTPITLTALIFGSMLLMMAIRVPIAVSMFGAGALAVGVVMALLTWRTSIGGLNAWTSKTGSMMMGLPEWIVYACMVPPLALTAAIAFTQAAIGFGGVDTVEAKEEHV